MKLGLGLIAISQLVAGFVLQMVVLRLVGAGQDTDAFVAAQTLPMVSSALLGMLFLAVWQPRLAVAANDPSTWHANHCAAQGQALICTVPLALLLAATATVWIPLLFPEFSAAQQKVVHTMTWPLFAAAVFNLQSVVALGAERARGRFYPAETCLLVATLLAIGLLFWAVPQIGVVAVAWSSLLRSLLAAALLHMLSGHPWPNLPAAWRARKAWKQLRAMLIGSALQKSNPLVERYWSAQGVSPGVTLLNFSQTGIVALAGVLERMVSVPVAPRIARLIARGDTTAALWLYRRGVALVLLMVVATGLVLLLLEPVWQPVMGHLLGLSAEHADLVRLFCLLLLPYLLSAGAGPVIVSVFYAYGDTGTPATIGVAGFLMGLILKAIGFKLGGLLGLAVAMSIGHLLSLGVLCLFTEITLHRSAAP